MMLRYVLEQELEGRRAGKTRKVAFFLVSLHSASFYLSSP